MFTTFEHEEDGSQNLVDDDPTGNTVHEATGHHPSSKLDESIVRRSIRWQTFQVRSIVNAMYQYSMVVDVNMIDATRTLRQAPIGGKGLVQQLKQERAIHTIVPDQQDYIRLTRMAFQDLTQAVRCARHKILQRFSTGKAH